MEKQLLIEWLDEQIAIFQEQMELSEQDTNSDYDFYDGACSAYQVMLTKVKEMN
jgi:hypothetical protein